MEQVPIRPIDSTNQKDQHIRDQLAALAESMPVMLNHMDELKTDHERKMMQRQIDTTDRQIDQLIYELYGLTAEEINIVEGMADND
jgi:hypothetical protein